VNLSHWTHGAFFKTSGKRRDHLEDLGIEGKIILEWALGKLNGKVCTRFIRLRIGTSGGLL
jgi:hypothetical protein